MNSTLAEVLDAARSLPRAERAEVAREMLATLDDATDESRDAELQAAVEKGTASLDAGKSIRVPVADISEYLRERGHLATERAAAKRA